MTFEVGIHHRFPIGLVMTYILNSGSSPYSSSCWVPEDRPRRDSALVEADGHRAEEQR